MPKVKINGQDVKVEAGMSVLQACEQVGVEIPRFCYHDRLSIAGNCRMCLVQIKPGSPKPRASCALPVIEGQEIITDSEVVEKARRGVMEFLLINHPLDCPVCDQGGECDLQDQSMAYGRGLSRFVEHKRAVAEKEMGPLVKTVMTRCIHCTRCVRFTSEVAGTQDMGLLYRGENVEISSLEQVINSELSANVIDLCPVGALTSKPYAFRARPWELVTAETVDVMDGLGSNIRIDTRGNEVLRVLPRLHEDVNEEWISDKTRYACDGLLRQRLDRPYLRDSNGRVREVSWDDALAAAGSALTAAKAGQIAAIGGDLVEVESLYALKRLLNSLGSEHTDCRQDGAKLGLRADGSAAPRVSWLFNTGVAGLEDVDALLIIGSDPRAESPVLNARIRKAWLARTLKVGRIGPDSDLTYPYESLGQGPDVLADLAAGKGNFFKVLKAAKRPALILGSGAVTRDDGDVILGLARKLADAAGMVRNDHNGFNVLHHVASRVGGLDIGFVPGKNSWAKDKIVEGCEDGVIKVLWLLGADELELGAFKRTFVIYQGHHGDKGAARADLILPGASYTEKSGSYVNLEGRVQLGRRAVFPPGDAREDWAIIRALSERVGHTLPFNDLASLRKVMRQDFPHLGEIDEVPKEAWAEFGSNGNVEKTPFQYPVTNFYQTCAISRNSITMAECTRARMKATEQTS